MICGDCTELSGQRSAQEKRTVYSMGRRSVGLANFVFTLFCCRDAACALENGMDYYWVVQMKATVTIWRINL